MIKCECELCVYNENRVCGLDELLIDGAGMCGDCIFPNFDKREIALAKEKTLAQLNKSLDSYID